MPKPIVILLNGLLAYQPAPLTPLAPLASQLEAIGFTTCVTNHFNTGCSHLVPDVIIGHSQGGATALTLAQRYPSALVITFDAVRMPACRGRCINFKTVGYPNVPGATNIPLSLAYDHITLPLRSDLQQRTLFYVRQITAKKEAPQKQIARTKSRAEILPSPSIDEPPGDHPLWFDRWPNTEFEELTLSLEQLCSFHHQPEVCPHDQP